MLEAISKDGELGILYRIKRADLLKREVTLTARPSHPLTVIVKDMNHNPLPGAEVFLATFYDPSSAFGKRVKTDANGEAVIPEVYEGGLYQPHLRLTGFYYDSMRVRLLPKVGSKEWKDRIELFMEPANRTQRGRVVYENGRPAEGVTVQAITSRIMQTVTNALGEFVFENMPYSMIALRTQKPGYFGEVGADMYSGDVVIKLQKITLK